MRGSSGPSFQASGSRAGPAWRAARSLARLGARVSFLGGPEQVGTVGFPGWQGEGKADSPRGGVRAQYLGLLAATRLLRGGGSVGGADAAGLTAGQPRGRAAKLVACSDGWLVARWRSAAERRLFWTCLPRRPPTIGEAAALARELRLLAAPVCERGGSGWQVRRTGRQGTRSARPGPLRVLDWSSLWAGPWACMDLAAAGAEVVRIEHPGRRDGYLAADPAFWTALNAGKALVLADAATPSGRRQISEALRWADIVVSGHSLRVLPQLGFDEVWFQRRAPEASLVELVAFAPPHETLPGLGEQAAAMAGLLWRGRQRPHSPRPWADPLAAALCSLLITAWEVGGRPGGARLRVSLEGSAGLALDD